MNIAFIHDQFPAGGAERVTIDIAKALGRYDGKYRIYVYCQEINETLMSEEISGCMTVRLIPCTNNKEKSARIEQAVIEDNIDIIVQVVHRLHDIQGIQKRTGVMVVMANHGEAFWQRYRIMSKLSKKRPLAWKLYLRFIYKTCGKAMRKAVRTTRTNYNSCDAYTVLCEEYKRQICGKLRINPDDSHIYVIPNIEYPVNDICYDKEKIIMYCGRLYNGTKRIDRLLDIWSMVQDRLPDWKLVLVGDGPDRKSIERQIEKDRLERIELVGWQKDVGQFYRKASICCLTSDTESWGLALTEAQANGVIPIAFDCSAGVRHILSPSGNNGFLITPYSKREFARTLIDIAEMTPQQQMSIRRNIVKKSRSYSPEETARKWAALFDRMAMLKKDR